MTAMFSRSDVMMYTAQYAEAVEHADGIPAEK